MKRIIIISILTCGIISSCTTYKSYKTPKVDATDIFGEEIEMVDSAAVVPTWKDMFPDIYLQTLIQQGIDLNTDLQTARLSIEQNEAALMASKLAFLPSISMAPTGGVSSFDNSKATYTYTLPLTTQWEIDINSKLFNTKYQSQAALEQSREYARLIQTQLVASIANSYYTLIMLEEQLKITKECVVNLKSNLDVIIALKEDGRQTEAAVNQARANYYAIQTTEKDLKKQISNTENSIVLLIKQHSSTIPHSSLKETMMNDVNLQDHISISALANRPDVRSAEYGLKQNFFGVNVARSAFYPSLSLTGSAGWTNNMGDVVINPGKILLSAIGSLTQPLFNKGINKANLKIAQANYEKSLLAFQQTILNAGVEVNNALVQCQNSSEKIKLREMQVKSNMLAVDNSVELMKNSSNTYLEVLVAQNTLLQSRLSQVTDWFENMQGRINLYKALGGGIR